MIKGKNMAPNTTVTLYATDFDITNKHVVYADSEGAAFAAVSSFPSKVYTNCYWQRTDGFVFRATGNINEVERFNYCIFENNGKRNYAFITKCQYVNDDMTWVYLEIDPWLNFAGQYDFHDSPMDRCHPAEDGDFENIVTPEPINVYPHVGVNTADYGVAGSDDSLTCVLTRVSATAYQGQATNFWNGLASMIHDGDASALSAMFSAISAQGCDCGVCVQANTSVVTAAQLAQIQYNYARVDKEEDMLYAYHIPKAVRTADGGLNIGAMAPFRIGIGDIDLTPGQWKTLNKWKKGWQSPQFNEVRLTVCGNTRIFSFDEIIPEAIQDGQIRFDGYATQDSAGCIAIGCASYAGAYGQSIVSGKQWDSVQINAVVTPNKQDYISTGIKGIADVIQAGVKYGVEGAAREFDAVGERIQGHSVVKGTNTTSIGTWNLMNPLVQAEYRAGDEHDADKLNCLFSTYGYNMGGLVRPINLNGMPHWTYNKTRQAAITGRGVPQRYLDQVIAMFNSGVFIYKTIGDYNRLEQWESNIL